MDGDRAPRSDDLYRNEDRWDRSNAIYADGRVLLYDKSRPFEGVAEMR